MHITDIDECATNNGNCGQTCNNTIGSYSCSCVAGYLLNADSRSCSGKINTFRYAKCTYLFHVFQILMNVQKTMEIVRTRAQTPLEAIHAHAHLATS